MKDVYVLEFSGEGSGRRWRRGAPMNEPRSFFACASMIRRKCTSPEVTATRRTPYASLRFTTWRKTRVVDDSADDGRKRRMSRIRHGNGSQSQNAYLQYQEMSVPVHDGLAIGKI
ncbi:unnamed protein product [Microthlaspi erraticum]|uniref:Uncharacterized protein n=1 Tax=Microthlaspi erraticum TaxID=1685480 RepID=A0A6D2KCB2_9BRAS|nr:unnamed protein product [Microthlaspi erraticum]CAA7045785.1 unnamed protein product [Microthlaspi erraticum]